MLGLMRGRTPLTAISTMIVVIVAMLTLGAATASADDSGLLGFMVMNKQLTECGNVEIEWENGVPPLYITAIVSVSVATLRVVATWCNCFAACVCLGRSTDTNSPHSMLLITSLYPSKHRTQREASTPSLCLVSGPYLPHQPALRGLVAPLFPLGLGCLNSAVCFRVATSLTLDPAGTSVVFILSDADGFAVSTHTTLHATGR